MHGTAPAPTCRAPRGAWGGLADVRLHTEKIANRLTEEQIQAFTTYIKGLKAPE